MRGEFFETKMAILLFLRSLNKNNDFHIASNMKAAKCFDDLVFTLEEQTAFMQLKYKENSKVYMSQLLTMKGDFSLLKYYKSYIEIKQNWTEDEDLQSCGKFEDSLFVLFTNATFENNVDSNNDLGSSDILELLNTQGRVTQFTEQHHKQIYNLFEKLPRYIELLSKAVNDDISDTSELLELVKILSDNGATCLPEKSELEKLLKYLQSIGNIQHYREFLSRLFLYSEQRVKADLDSLIKSELTDLFGNVENFEQFIVEIMTWWNDNNVYLAVETKFFQEMIQEVATTIIKDISTLKISFRETEQIRLKQNFPSDKSHMYLYTDNGTLSSIKVVQSFGTQLLVDVNTLTERTREVLVVWRFGKWDMLVIEGATEDTNILSRITNMPDHKHIVVISKHQFPQLYHQFNFSSFTDHFCLSQLESDSQREILEHEALFQGYSVKLNSLVDDSFLQNNVTSDIVFQVEIGCKLDDLNPCYIPRTFLRKVFVSKEIFKEKNLAFALTGKSADRMKEILPEGDRIQEFYSNTTVADRSYRFFLIEEEDRFTALCEIKENIHWIEFCGDKFIWKKSQGDMSHVIKYLQEKSLANFSSQEILALPQQVVLIVAEPGMGKSTEMSNIAHMIKKNDPSTWVITLDLIQHINLLSQGDDVLQLLQKVAGLHTQFQRCLLQHHLDNTGNVVVILENYDEIIPNYLENGFNLFDKLSSYKIRKIFVTSRQFDSMKLQQQLSTLPFTFHTFTRDDNETFLSKYWAQLDIHDYKLSDFISSLLEKVQESLIDKLKEFIGIPLQAKMMAEVFQDEASHYCQTGKLRLPQNFDISGLYDKFIEKKWQEYCKKHVVDLNKSHDIVNCLKFHSQQSFMACALVSYLHDNDIHSLYGSEIILKQNKEFIERLNNGMEKTGIVTSVVDNKVVFVHRTFTEYFVALWFSNSFDCDIKRESVKKIYFNKSFDIAQGLLDRILAEQHKLHSIVLKGDKLALFSLLSDPNVDVNEKDKGGRTALHLAIMNYYNSRNVDNDHIVETLLERGADIECKDKVLQWRPLQFAMEVRAWFVVDKLLEKSAKSYDLTLIQNCIKEVLSNPDSKDCDVFYSALNAALEKGYIYLLKFIMENGIEVNFSVSDEYNYRSPMLYTAAKHGQVALMKFLVEHGANVNLTGGEYGRTPLIQAVASGHFEAVRLLIENKADINAQDRDGQTALFLAACGINDDIVNLLLYNSANTEIAGGGYSRTPLMWAVTWGNLPIVKLLITHGASVNASNKYGESPLRLAYVNNKPDIIELLKQNGATQ